MAILSLYSVENLGARYIHAALKAAGYPVHLIMLKQYSINYYSRITEFEVDSLLKILTENMIQTVGISVRSPYVLSAARITQRINQELDLPVIWGGTAPTLDPEECLAHGPDFIVRGEGEEAVVELMDALSGHKGDVGAIRNIGSLDKSKERGVHLNPVRPLLNDLDALPQLDLSPHNKWVIDANHVRAEEPLEKTVKYQFIASRGCPYNCSYCSNAALKEVYANCGWKIRHMSPERVIKDVREARATLPKIRSILFVDEIFAMNWAWTKRFTELYASQIGIPFECQCDPRTVTEGKIHDLKEAGLVEMTLGLQSGSERVRYEVFDRKVTDQDIKTSAHLLHKYTIAARYDLITDNPYEQESDKQLNLHMLLELPRPYILNIWSLYYLPQTALTRRALAEGIIDQSDVVGRSESDYQYFTASLGQARPVSDRFWVAMYMLASKPFLPVSFVRLLSKVPGLKRHPQPLMLLARISSIVRLFTDGLKLILSGRLNPAFALRLLRNLDSLSR
ncbi:MAG: cobalamin-dependent protein [Desulfovermiculus sp.]|nr:cobalamin-dependent protein [Desulfovermiculus sp.]